MGKKNEGKLNRISTKVFMRITRRKSKKIINKEFKAKLNKREIQLGEKLTKEEYNYFRKEFLENRGKEIIREEARKARIKAKIFALVGVIGISGIEGYKLGANNNKILGITEGKTAIEIDMNKVNKNVEVENVNKQEKEDKHLLFVRELQDLALNENVEYADELRKEVTKEIESLETSDEVLEYTKQIYVDRYNSVHDEQIGTENIEIYKRYYDEVFYEDYAQNGDVILRRCSDVEARKMGLNSDGNRAEISVKIYNKNNVTVEQVAYKNGKFVTLYGKDEEVVADKETTLCDVGEVIFQGIDRYVSMDDDETSLKVKEQYKSKFIQAVVDYKASRNDKVKDNSEDGR